MATVGSLRSLSVAVGRISSGELQTRVPVESDNEVGDLAAAVNFMASRFEAGLAKERDLTESRREWGRARFPRPAHAVGVHQGNAGESD